MKNDDAILLTKKDYLRIRHYINQEDSEDLEMLEIEIERAQLIEDEAKIPSDLVTMNSVVKFKTIQDQKESSYELVYPHEANSSQGKISVLAPLGSALIGLRKNQTIDWKFPDGKTKTIIIIDVQPGVVA